jgi:hypothetical protein
MPEAMRDAKERKGKPTGGRALMGVALAILGALAGVQPANTLLTALSEVVPQLAGVVPPLLTACGAILAAVSEPPAMK